MLVLRRIHVVFTLTGAAADKHEAARRTHSVFKMRCPVYRSIYRAIDVTTELEFDASAHRAG